MFDIKKKHQNSRLGHILLKRNYLSSEQLAYALQQQKNSTLQLGELLLSLGYINQKQLNRALRKQNLIRSITAGLALVLTPISPLFAMGSGGLGITSSVSSQIILSILPKSINTSPNNLKFNSNSKTQISERFCTSSFVTNSYHIMVEGSGQQGAFTLKDNNNQELAYQVSFKHQNNQYQPLSQSKPSGSYSNGQYQDKVICQNNDESRFKISLQETAKGNADSIYSGYLSVTIAAE